MGERIHSIDSLRAIAVFFVVIAHVQPFAGFGSHGNYIYFVFDTIGQFDVPFFFVTSGYFLKSKLDSGERTSGDYEWIQSDVDRCVAGSCNTSRLRSFVGRVCFCGENRAHRDRR